MTKLPPTQLPVETDRFLAILVTAQKERKARGGWVDDPVFSEQTLEWVLFERQAMLTAVNLRRQELGLQPITAKELVRKAETSASGHIDYSRKYALYCAEIANGWNPRVP